MFSALGDSISKPGRYLEYTGGCSVRIHLSDIMIFLGEVMDKNQLHGKPQRNEHSLMPSPHINRGISNVKCVHWVLAHFSIQFKQKSVPISSERTLEKIRSVLKASPDVLKSFFQCSEQSTTHSRYVPVVHSLMTIIIWQTSALNL